MTTYQIVDVAIADHPNLVTISRDLELEALAGIPGIIDAWVPGTQYVTGTTGPDFRFRGRFNGREMLARTAARPVESVSGGEMLLGVGVDGLPTDPSTANGGFYFSAPSALESAWTASFLVRVETGAARTILSFDTDVMDTRTDVSVTDMRVSPHRGTPSIEYAVVQAGALGGTFVVTLAYNGSRMITRINGVQKAQRGVSLAPADLWIGFGCIDANQSAGAGYRFGSAVIASRDLTATPDDLTAIEGYLMQRYGITPA